MFRRTVPRSSIVFYEPPGIQPHDEIIFDMPAEPLELDTGGSWDRTAIAWTRIASRTPWGGGTGAYFEPVLVEPPAPDSKLAEYADVGRRSALGLARSAAARTSVWA